MRKIRKRDLKEQSDIDTSGLIVRFNYNVIDFLEKGSDNLFYQIILNDELPVSDRTSEKFWLIAKELRGKKVEFYDAINGETYPARIIFMEGAGINGTLSVHYTVGNVDKVARFNIVPLEAYTR